jgi:hypothetical protein
MKLAGYEFVYICDIEPVRNPDGSVQQFMPQARYDNLRGVALNKYGQGPFCKFRIPNLIRTSGVYVLTIDDEIRYPLMTTDKSWAILQNRLVSLLEETTADYQVLEVLRTVRGSLDKTSGMEDSRTRLAQIIKACCDALRVRLDRRQIKLNESVLKEYFDLTMVIAPPPPMPDIYLLWKEVQEAFESNLENADHTLLNEETLSKWIAVIQIMLRTDRRLLIQRSFPERYDEFIETLCNVVTQEADASVTYPDDDAISSESDWFSSISNDLDELTPHFRHLEDLLQGASRDAYLRSRSLRDMVRSRRDSEQPNLAHQRSATSNPALDLERLFSDL